MFGAPSANYAPGTVYALNALDPYTGEIVWQFNMPGNINVAPEKVDDVHFMLFTGTVISYSMFGGATYDPDSITWMVYNINDGSFAFNVTHAPIGGSFLYDSNMYITSETAPKGVGTIFHGWELSSMNETHTVTQSWSWTNPGGVSFENVNCYGDDRIYLISWGDSYIRALNVKTGELDWEVDGPTNLRDGIFYNHKVYTAGIGQFLITYDAATGDKIWEWSASPRDYFANAGCAAYGMFFAMVVGSPMCYFAAWDDETGEMLWKVPAAYNIGYFNPVMADGKVYCVLSDGRGVSSLAYLPEAYSACMDAFTGEILWTVPYTFGTGSNTATGGFRGDLAIAYGSLWYEQDKILYCINDLTSYDHSMWLGNAETPDVAVGVPAPSDIAYPAWSYKTDGPVTGSPVVVDGILYEGSQDKVLYALNATTGAKLWTFTTGYKIRSTPAVYNGVVFTGTDDGKMYALDAKTGDLKWTKTDFENNGLWMGQYEFMTGSEFIVRSSPVIVNGRIYVGSLNGFIYCINPADGATMWKYETGGPVAGSAAYDNGIIYICSTEVSTGKLYALNAANGNLVWSLTIPSSGNSLFGTPCIAGDYIFLGPGADTSGLRVITKATGEFTTFANGTAVKLPETGTTPRCYTPTFYDGDLWNGTSKLNTPLGVIFACGGFRMECWNVSALIAGEANSAAQQGYTLRGTLSGSSLAQSMIWQCWLGHQQYSSPLLTTGQDGAKLYVGNDIGSITCIDAASGQALSGFATPGLVQATAAVWRNMIFIGHTNFNIYAFGTEPSVPVTVAASSVSDTVSSGSSTTIDIRAFSPQEYYDYAYQTTQMFYPAIRDAAITVTIVKPDGSSQQLTATTDDKGVASVTFTPTAAGTYKVTAEYAGVQYFGYNYAAATSVETSFTATGGSTTTTPSHPPLKLKPLPHQTLLNQQQAQLTHLQPTLQQPTLQQPTLQQPTLQQALKMKTLVTTTQPTSSSR
jgi:outer membrane protein assembly factor BamB